MIKPTLLNCWRCLKSLRFLRRIKNCDGDWLPGHWMRVGWRWRNHGYDLDWHPRCHPTGSQLLLIGNLFATCCHR